MKRKSTFLISFIGDVGRRSQIVDVDIFHHENIIQIQFQSNCPSIRLQFPCYREYPLKYEESDQKSLSTVDIDISKIKYLLLHTELLIRQRSNENTQTVITLWLYIYYDLQQLVIIPQMKHLTSSFGRENRRYDNNALSLYIPKCNSSDSASYQIHVP